MKKGQKNWKGFSKKALAFAGALALSASIATSAFAETQQFKDVPTNFRAYHEIQYLAEKGIIKGYLDGNFGVNDNITRIQALTMILREKGITDFSNLKDPGLIDMKPGTYGYEVVAKAVELGIVQGKTNANGQKYFDPSGKLTRAQMASILANAYQLKGTTDVVFSDVPKSHWAYEAVKALANNGITVGYGNGTFGTNDPITRTQYAVMMARLLDESFAPTTPPSNSNQNTPGKTYPDGWTAPVLKSSVKSDFKENLEILRNELGFTAMDGQFYIIDENHVAIVYLLPSPNAEADLKFCFWDNSDFENAYRIPIVAKEFLKLFFEDDYMIPFNYLNEYFHNGVVPPKTFTANGKNVKTYEQDGNVIFQIQK